VLRATKDPFVSNLTLQAMAEAVAALEPAAAITAFIELGVTVVKRLKQFHNDVDDVHEAF
jgi:hypothetical protein